MEYVKQTYSHLPVIVLTARYSLSSKEKCFKSGADDYLTKPFELLELELRISALLRRFDKEKILNLRELTIDLKNKLLLKNGIEIPVTGRTWALLCYFLENRNRVISKSQIIEHVWQDTVVSEDSIRAYVKELRKILPEGSIVTYKGRGYRFVG